MPPALFFFFSISLAFLGHLWFHISLSIVCSSSLKTVPGYYRLHLICKLYGHFSNINFCKSKRFLSILNYLQFPSLLFYSFQHIDLPPHWLHLFLGCWNFKWDYLLNFLFLIFHFLCKGILQISVYYSCILPCCCIHLIVLKGCC